MEDKASVIGSFMEVRKAMCSRSRETLSVWSRWFVLGWTDISQRSSNIQPTWSKRHTNAQSQQDGKIKHPRRCGTGGSGRAQKHSVEHNVTSGGVEAENDHLIWTQKYDFVLINTQKAKSWQSTADHESTDTVLSSRIQGTACWSSCWFW